MNSIDPNIKTSRKNKCQTNKMDKRYQELNPLFFTQTHSSATVIYAIYKLHKSILVTCPNLIRHAK